MVLIRSQGFCQITHPIHGKRKENHSRSHKSSWNESGINNGSFIVVLKLLTTLKIKKTSIRRIQRDQVSSVVRTKVVIVVKIIKEEYLAAV